MAWEVSSSDRTANARLTAHDLMIIAYAVHELRAATDEWEFPILVGASTKEADELIQRARDALDQIPQDLASGDLEGARLAEHLRQLQTYGSSGMRQLESGRIRYYGQSRSGQDRW